MTFIHRLAGALAVIGMVSLIACGSETPATDPGAVSSSADTPAYGDIMVEGSIGDASNLLSLLSSDSTSHEIASLVFNGLVKYDREMRVVGDLAESWDISGDGLEITFHLR
ncbi:MAG: peptide-binding protein, partial [Syntrophaceae bacterium]|nr:peptide-binding protein [Syntrophaceae bacterium]